MQHGLNYFREDSLECRAGDCNVAEDSFRSVTEYWYCQMTTTKYNVGNDDGMPLGTLDDRINLISH
jgi:hypothetical protein